MASVQVQQGIKRQIKKRDVLIAILLILLIQAGIFAYFYFKGRDLSNTVLNKLGPVQSPTPVFGIYGSGSIGPLSKPMAVTVHDRNVYVSDTGNARVAVFDYNGQPLFTFGKDGQDKGQFKFPYGITVDNAGLIYVADLYNGNIQVFSSDGKFIKYFLDPQAKIVSEPAGLVYFDNTIYVTDVALHKVMAFDLNGKKVLEFGTAGKGKGEFASPNTIAVTRDRIYVVDTGNDRFETFDRSGKFISESNGSEAGAKSSSLLNPRGVGVDGRGTVYVVSNLTNNVFGFDQEGKKPFAPFGEPGSEDNQFRLPNGLYVDDQGRIFITDTVNQRVMVYQN